MVSTPRPLDHDLRPRSPAKIQDGTAKCRRICEWSPVDRQEQVARLDSDPRRSAAGPHLFDTESRIGTELESDAFLMSAPELKAPADKIRKLWEPVTGTPTLVMRERPAEHTRPTFLR